MSDLIISIDSLRSKLFDWGIDESKTYVLLTKAHYAVIDEQFLLGEFAAKLKPFLAEWVGPYVDGPADDPSPSVCSDFADAASFYMAACYRRTKDRPAHGGPGFGPFWFKRDSGGNHDLNIFLALSNDIIIPKFFDPQTCTLSNLTQSEVSRCYSFRMP